MKPYRSPDLCITFLKVDAILKTSDIITPLLPLSRAPFTPFSKSDGGFGDVD